MEYSEINVVDSQFIEWKQNDEIKRNFKQVSLKSYDLIGLVP